MNVQELIDSLNRLKNKQQPVYMADTEYTAGPLYKIESRIIGSSEENSWDDLKVKEEGLKDGEEYCYLC